MQASAQSAIWAEHRPANTNLPAGLILLSFKHDSGSSHGEAAQATLDALTKLSPESVKVASGIKLVGEPGAPVPGLIPHHLVHQDPPHIANPLAAG